MELSKFIEEFEISIQGTSVGGLNQDTKFQELEEWDSVAILNIIGFIDIEFSTQIAADKILKCHTINEVYELVLKGCIK